MLFLIEYCKVKNLISELQIFNRENYFIFSKSYCAMDKIQKIKNLVKQKNLIYEDFAKKIGKSKPTVVNYFNKKSKIDIDTIEKIAEVLDVPVSYFFEDGENNTNSIDKELLRIFKKKVSVDIVAFESLDVIRKFKPKTEEDVFERMALLAKYLSYVHLEIDEIKYLYDNSIITSDFYNELKTLYKGRYKK